MKKQNNKRVLSFLLVFVLLLSMIPVTVFAVNGDVTLTVIHVNDRHGRMGADPYIAQLAKDTKGNVLVLDAGDALHGQITANLTKGAAMAELMNEVGYSAMAVGNHEFTYGVERITELAEMMDFPLLAANVRDANGKPLFAHHALFNMKGLTVGVFGLATPETIESNDPRLMAGIVIDDPVKTAKAEVAELQAEGCDIIIALTHLGIEKDDALAAVSGIDVIIDGHSHTAYPNGLTAGNTLVAQAGEYGENIGVVEITVSGDKTTKTAKLIPVDDTLAADAAITAKIAELDAENEAYTSEVVGKTPVFLQGEKTAIRTGQSNLADLITDSMRKATGADMAFMSGGNIRASIDAGDITLGEVLTTLPYSNLITTVTLTGADIQKILEHGVASYPEAAATYIHVSGLRFTFDPEAAAGQRVATITMSDGTTLEPDKTYTVATIDFIAAGGDGYDMMLNGTDLTYYGGDAEAFISYLKAQPVINAEPDNRASALAKDALYVVMPDATHGFLGESIRHAEDELKKLANKTGLDYKLFETADAALQSEALDEAILANAGAVVLWPITGEPLRDAAQRVMDADIPLIIYDRLIEDFAPVAEVLGDNMKIAQTAGAYFNDYFSAEIASGKTINIIELAGDDSTVPKQRTQGFMEIAGANANVVQSFDTQWQREVAREHMAKWLKTASKKEIESIQAIYSHEDETVLGAMDAIAAYNGPAKLNIRLILGLGGKRDLIMHMGYYKEHFDIDLVTYQFSPAMVREAIQDGARVLNGETIAAEHLIDTFEIDHETLGAYLASDAYKTRYTTAMPKIDNVPVNAWYSFAVSSRAIEFYTAMAGGYDPDEAITTEYASQILASSLPFSVTVAGGSELLTRQRFAGMLMDALVCYGLIETNGTPNYTDAEQISSAYKKAADYVYKTGLMRGVGGGKFDPEGNITRSQIAVAMYNVVEACLKAAAAPQQKRIAVWTGTAFEQIYRDNIGNATFIQVNSANECLDAVRRGTADATMLDEPIARKLLHGYTDLTMQPDYITHDDYGFAFGKENDALREQFNAFLAEIKADGILGDMVSRWLDTENAPPMPEIPNNGKNGTLIFATTCKDEPFSYMEKGKPTGFDVELALRFAAYAGYILEITPMDFGELLPAVQSGDADFAGELIIITETRKQLVDFSDPYYSGGTVLVVPSSLSEFSGAHIGALDGTVFADFIDPLITGVKYTYYPSQADMEAALSKGEVDAIALDMPVAKYVAAQNPSFTVFPEVLAADRYGFALVKGAPLADKVNDAIRKLRNNGTIAALEKVWFSADDSVKKLPSLTYKKDFDGSAGTLRYGCENSTAPVSYINADGKPVGFDLAVVSYIAYELNMKVEFFPIGFENIFAALESGEIDMAGGCMSLTEQRQQNYSCVGPYYDGGVVFVVRK